MILALVYSLPFLILAVFFGKDMVNILKIMAKPPEQRDAILQAAVEKQEAEKRQTASLSHKSSPLQKFAKTAFIVLVGPVFLLRLAIGLKYGVRFLNRLPIDTYHLWFLTFYLAGFYYADSGYPIVAILVAVYIGVTLMVLISQDFTLQDGNLRLFSVPRHKRGLVQFLINAFLVQTCFALVYYSIPQLDPASFNSRPSAAEALLASLNSVLRIPFVSLVPVSPLAKLIMLLHAVLGFLFTVVILAVFVRVWMGTEPPPQNDRNAQ